MLTEMRDTVGLVTAWQGADPEKASLDEYMKAIDKIQEEVGLRSDPRLHRQRVHQGHHRRATRG